MEYWTQNREDAGPPITFVGRGGRGVRAGAIWTTRIVQAQRAGISCARYRDAERRTATDGACDDNGHRGDGRGQGDLRALDGMIATEGIVARETDTTPMYT